MMWQSLLDALVQLVAVILLAVGTAAMRRLADWLRLAADDRARGYLNDAMDNAILRGLALARAKQDGNAGAAIVHAAAYVEDHVPDALTRLAIDRAALERLLHARLVRDHPGAVSP